MRRQSDRPSRPLPPRLPSSRRLAASALGLGLPLLLAAASSAPAANLYVGTTCTYSSLNSALIAAAFTLNEDDEIRLTVTASNINRELRNFNPATIGAVTIAGGFTSCTSERIGDATSTITGNGTDSVFEIVSDGAASNVTFDHVVISGTNARAVTVDGAAAEVRFLHSKIEFSGGALEVSGGPLIVLDRDSEIRDNDSGATPGAGISCHGSHIVSAANIRNNHTTSSGGGVFLDGGCTFELQSNSFIGFNTATWGGGFAVSAGSELIPDSEDGVAFALINANEAELQGGGVYVVNGAEAMLENTWVLGNEAGQRGAGLYAETDAEIFMTADHSAACGNLGCSLLSSNELVDSPSFRQGSAAYAAGNSTIGIFQTQVHSNQDFDRRGYPLFAVDPGTLLSLEGVSLADNHSRALLQAEDGATISAAFVSAARNNWEAAGSPQIADAAGVSGSATVEIFSSVLWDHGPFDVEAGSSATVDCVMAETVAGATSASRFTTGLDPLFVDPASNNLRVAATSRAVDYCDVSAYTPLFGDVDGQPRGWDALTVVNQLGPYDLGAFELYGLLFGDGFESADTAAWTSSTP